MKKPNPAVRVRVQCGCGCGLRAGRFLPALRMRFSEYHLEYQETFYLKFRLETKKLKFLLYLYKRHSAKYFLHLIRIVLTYCTLQLPNVTEINFSNTHVRCCTSFSSHTCTFATYTLQLVMQQTLHNETNTHTYMQFSMLKISNLGRCGLVLRFTCGQNFSRTAGS